MRVFFLAFICFVLSGIHLLPHISSSLALDASIQSGAALALLVVALLLQIEGIMQIKNNSRLASLAAERAKLERDLAAAELEKQKLITEKQAALDHQEHGEAEVVQFLSLLQEKGRFIDFLMEDVSGYADQQVGAAARVVHSGCARVLREHFAISSLADAAEGSSIAIEEGFAPQRYRLLGKVGRAPYKGTIVHPGWRTEKIALPTLVDAKQRRIDGFHIISPVEVELH